MITRKVASVEVRGVRIGRTRAEDRTKMAELTNAAIRLRNYGAPVSVIADKLGLSESDAEALLSSGLRDLVSEDAQMVRARQQAVINDIRRAVYPAVTAGDVAASGVMLKTLSHEADLHGLKAPTRVNVGLDQESFTTTVSEDMRVLGVRTDTPLDDDDEDGWSNT